MGRWGWPRSSRLAAWLVVGMCGSVALLAWFGFRASREFQESSRQLVQRRADEAARLMVAALTRDMRAAQSAVLSSSTWDDLGSGSSHELNALVASAFARYPYPEAFFTWEARGPEPGVTFYTRADRRPGWAPPADEPVRYPVRVVTAPDVARGVLASVRRDAASGRPYSISEIEIGSAPYQLVTLIRYGDPLRQRVVWARGFMVSLPWAREHYFAELMREVARIGGENPGLALAIVDDRGQPVAGDPGRAGGAFVSRRQFPLAFFDPVLAASSHPSIAPRSWTVLASAAGDASFDVARYGADLTLGLAALAAIVLAVGLGVTARAMRMSVDLAEMRAEFMSSVTHELKTPIASIQAMGETLSRGRLRDPRAQQDYAAAVTQEAKRLGRLVNNVLAYARITDVADVYSFEPLDIDEVIDASLARFARQLQQDGFALTVDVPADVPSVLADRAAMELLVDNLIDNAVRHSGSTKAIRVAVGAGDGRVWVEIADRGLGIAPEDVARVTQKFVRGRNAAAGGSGLGLAIVARIVKDHQGTFTIESALGQGTTARVVLPAAADERVERRGFLSRASL